MAKILLGFRASNARLRAYDAVDCDSTLAEREVSRGFEK